MVTVTDTRRARLHVLKQGLRLEILGMTRNGRSCYSIIKSEFGLKGSKQHVYDACCKILADYEEDK